MAIRLIQVIPSIAHASDRKIAKKAGVDRKENVERVGRGALALARRYLVDAFACQTSPSAACALPLPLPSARRRTVITCGYFSSVASLNSKSNVIFGEQLR